MPIVSRRRPSSPVAAARSAAERLEARRLFAAAVVGPIADTSGDLNGTSTIDLNDFFNDPTFELVKFATPQGDFRVRLVESQKPVTVGNFMKYVKDRDATGAVIRRYDGTIIHRSDPLNGDDAAAPDIVQGGGYKFPGFAHLDTLDPIANEFTTNGTISNTRGTIAMAKTSDPNSATSEWFVNLRDNSTALDSPSNSGGFTVFGRVLDADLPVLDAIAALPRFNFQSPFSAIPLRNYTEADFNAQKVPTADNVVGTTVTELPDLTYAVASSDPSIAAAAVDAGGNLVITYGATRGTAQITVTATDEGGQSVQQAFTANAGGIDVTVGGTSGNKSVSFTDADGTVATISLKGNGSATVQLLGGGLAQTTSRGRVTVTGTSVSATNIAVTGSDAGTTVTISAKGGTDRAVTIGGLAVAGAVKAISGKGTVLAGTLSTAGAAGAVTLAGATGGTIALGGAASDRGASLSLGTLADTDVTVGSPIRSMKVTAATGADATADVVSAPSIDSVSSAGDFAADVTVPGEGNLRSLKVGGNLTGDVSAHQVGSVSVKGDVTGSTITATHSAAEAVGSPDAKGNQGVQSVKVGGGLTNAVIDSAATIGSVSAASAAGSRIVAGAPGLTTLPTTAAELVQPASLLSLKVKGAFANTVVAARTIGKVSVGSITTGNGGTPFGFAADRIVSIAGRSEAGAGFKGRNIVDEPGATATLSPITANDLVLRVV